MSITLADATVLTALPPAAIVWLTWRKRKADAAAMEKLVAKVTEEASEEYRAEIARMDQQYKDEIRRLEKQYKESILWYQKQLGGHGDG